MAAIRAAKGFNELLEHFPRFRRGPRRQIGHWWRLTCNRGRIFPAATSNRRTPSPEAAPRSGSRAYAGEPCLQKPRGIFEGMVRLHRLGYQSAAQLLATESCG